jgi:hypothetical protein
MVLLVWGLGRLGGDPRRAVLWAWCPTVALEAASNAHIDVVAALLAAAGLLALSRPGTRSRVAVGGVLLGLAVATKVTPALVLPAVLRRRPVTVGLSVVGAVVTVYLPHVLAVGTAVLGYLPGYLREEGYDSGSRFALLTLVVPPAWAGAVAVGLLVVAGAWLTRTANPDRPWEPAATLVGVALLVTTPDYPWYALLLVVLVGLGARWWWLAVAAAGYVAQFHHELHLDPGLAARLGYGAALLVIVGAAVIRRSTTPWDTAAVAPRAPDTVEA